MISWLPQIDWSKVNVDQLLAQAVTVLIGGGVVGVIVGLILAKQKDRFETRQALRKHHAERHRIRAGQLRELYKDIADYCYTSTLSVGRMEQIDKGNVPKKEAIEELRPLVRNTFEAAKDLVAKAQQYGKLPAELEFKIPLGVIVYGFTEKVTQALITPLEHQDMGKHADAFLASLGALTEYEDRLAELAFEDKPAKESDYPAIGYFLICNRDYTLGEFASSELAMGHLKGIERKPKKEGSEG